MRLLTLLLSALAVATGVQATKADAILHGIEKIAEYNCNVNSTINQLSGHITKDLFPLVKMGFWSFKLRRQTRKTAYIAEHAEPLTAEESMALALPSFALLDSVQSMIENMIRMELQIRHDAFRRPVAFVLKKQKKASARMSVAIVNISPDGDKGTAEGVGQEIAKWLDKALYTFREL